MSNLPPSHGPTADVRMRGFASRSTVEQALAWLDDQLAPLTGERVSLRAAAGRVLACDLTSDVDVPAFARAMMDGYAVRSADTLGASAYNRLPLTVIGEALPGVSYDGSVGPREAVRIMTGAPLPPGADAVLPVEKVDIEGDSISALDAVTTAMHVGSPGEDITAGSIVLKKHRVLRPQDIGLISSIGVGEIDVVRRPRVRIVTTGNELLPAGSAPRGCLIADANGPMLHALVTRDGGQPIEREIVPDDRDAILTALRDEADVVIVSGGSSVGQEDHVPVLLAEHGELAIHGIAMRPSSPTGLGRMGHRLVFLLPGNPVSCLCAYDFFASRAIRALGGRDRRWPYRSLTGTLKKKISSVIGRLDYCRVKITDKQVEPLAISGASVLSSTTRADGFLIIPANSEGMPPGASVEVFLYD